MTIFFADISGFQEGINTRGLLAVACKATEGTTYANPDFARARANAASNDVFFMAYHFLHAGNALGQARWCFENVGPHTPLMLDVEPTSFAASAKRSNVDLPEGVSSNPNEADVAAFVSAYRSFGGTVHLMYLPHWYWQQQGSPSLSGLSGVRLALWSSEYTSYTDTSGVRGWQPYGGVAPSIWQYSDSVSFNGHTVDFSAFRGSFAGKQDAASVSACLKELESLAMTGSVSGDPIKPMAKNPVVNLWAVHRYTQADIGWNRAEGAKSYQVLVWQRRKLLPFRKLHSSHETTSNKLTVTGLKPNTTYQVTVVAMPASAWALKHRLAVFFHTK